MLTIDQVDTMLQDIGPQQVFTVVFLKQDGSERAVEGFLEGGWKDGGLVCPMKETSSGKWKSFNKSKVVSIEIP